MRNWKKILAGLFLSLSWFPVFSQRAVYTDYSLGRSKDRDVFCVVSKNEIHAWVVPINIFTPATKSSEVDVYVFSMTLQQLDHRQFDLGRTNIFNVDFDYSDTDYCAKIFCGGRDNITRIFHSIHPGIAEEVTGNYQKHEILTNQENSTPWFAIRRQDSLLFTASVKDHESAILNTQTAQFSVSRKPENKATDSEILPLLQDLSPGDNHLNIQILNSASGKLKQVTYSSRELRFRSPRILIHGNNFWLTAQVEKDPEMHLKNENSLFFVKLDTALQEIHGEPEFIQLNKGNRYKGETYKPGYIFLLNKKLVILSIGKYYPLKYTYTYNAAGALIHAGSSEVNYAQQFIREQVLHNAQMNDTEKALLQFSRPKMRDDEKTGSVRLTMIDLEGQLHNDTVLNNHQRNGFIEWDNFLAITDKRGVHLFCGIKYRNNRMGIAYIHIDQEGKLEITELNIDVNSRYSIQQAQLIAPGVLLMPYTHRNNIGLMRLMYY